MNIYTYNFFQNYQKVLSIKGKNQKVFLEIKKTRQY
jgi:hypothetical protein